MASEYVRGHRWSLGRDGTHPGYYRKKRPKGRKRIVDKKPNLLYAVRDQYGHFEGGRIREYRQGRAD